jgi:hypothetical protein
MELERAAVLELAEVLGALGINADIQPEMCGRRPDLRAEINGRLLLVEVKVRATVTPRDVDSLVADTPTQTDATQVVVADRVVEPAREALRDAGWGWFDRRGHLRLNAPGVLVELDVPSTITPKGLREPLAGSVALETATWILAHPDGSPGVRELARELDRAPSSVSEALNRLEHHGLITPDLGPVVPELFWETVGRWTTPRQPLKREPPPGDSGLTQRLELGFVDVENTTGWALTDTLAAAAYGAPLGVASATPPDFLVPSAEVERLARIILGTAPGHERGCTVRAAPARWACQRRVDGVLVNADTHWPLAQPLFVALDLATDPGRGREILEAWTPPEPWHRVW